MSETFALKYSYRDPSTLFLFTQASCDLPQGSSLHPSYLLHAISKHKHIHTHTTLNNPPKISAHSPSHHRSYKDHRILQYLITCIMTETEANAPFVDVVLYAEFDIDKGSTLRESYPTFFSHYSAEFFADVMLPEGVHNREDDFTIFFLNRKTMQSPALIPAKQNDFPNASEFMYCLSVVRTTHDNTLRRGARIKAVAICSRFKVLFARRAFGTSHYYLLHYSGVYHSKAC